MVLFQSSWRLLGSPASLPCFTREVACVYAGFLPTLPFGASWGTVGVISGHWDAVRCGSLHAKSSPNGLDAFNAIKRRRAIWQ